MRFEEEGAPAGFLGPGGRFIYELVQAAPHDMCSRLPKQIDFTRLQLVVIGTKSHASQEQHSSWSILILKHRMDTSCSPRQQGRLSRPAGLELLVKLGDRGTDAK